MSPLPSALRRIAGPWTPPWRWSSAARFRLLFAATVVVSTALHVRADFLWHAQDDGIQQTDAAYHFSRVVEHVRALDGGPRTEDRQRYGDLVYVVAARIVAATEPDPRRLLRALGLLYWPTLTLAGGVLAGQLALRRQRLAMLLGAALVGCVPGLFDYARVVVLDAPLALAVLGAVVCALRATETRRARWWAAAAACAFAAVQVKVNAVVFLAGPALVLAGRRWPRALAGLGGAGLLLVGGLWAQDRLQAVLVTLTDSTWPGAWLFGLVAGRSAAVFDEWRTFVQGHAWEAVYYVTLQTLTPAWLGLGAVFGGLWLRRGRRRGLVAAWVLLPGVGVLLGLRDLFDERYLLPLLPPLSATVAAGIAGIDHRWLRWAAASSAAVVGAAVFAHVSFPVVGPAPAEACVTLPGGASDRVGDLWLCPWYERYAFMDRPSHPRPPDPRQDRFVAELEFLARQRGKPARAAFLDDTYDLFYAVHQRGLLQPGTVVAEDLLLLTRCADREHLTAWHGSPAAAAAEVFARDTLVVRWQGRSATPYGRRCEPFVHLLPLFEERFSQPLPDGSEWRLLTARRAEAHVEESP